MPCFDPKWFIFLDHSFFFFGKSNSVYIWDVPVTLLNLNISFKNEIKTFINL